MFLEELEVREIRNLRPQTVRFQKRVTVIHGQNGQGKTSLLEAIYLLSHSKSFRASHVRDVVSWKEPQQPAMIRGVVRSPRGRREIVLEIERGRKTLTLDGKKAQAAGQFFGQLRCVSFTPEELQLVKGPPQIRRQYIDRTLAMVDQKYLLHLVQYQRALKQRNTVLGLHASEAGGELLPWELLLEEHGSYIAAARNSFIEALGPAVRRFYAELCERSPAAAEERIGLAYQSNVRAGGEFIPKTELLQGYQGDRPRDRRLKSTRLGIHRDDIEIVFSGASVNGAARALASQGQTRTIALALKLAAIEYIELRTGDKPLLLLDDVESELDPARREGLFHFLQQSEHQVLITTTDPGWAPSHQALEVAELEIEYGLLR